jgi:cell filamentation protein
VLLAFESLKVTKRLEELLENPFKIKDSNSLLEIHHHLFQDVYEWAGVDLRPWAWDLTKWE